MEIEADKRYMRLAITDRHWQNMPAEHYLIGTLSFNADAYQVAYRMVMEWYEWKMFDGFDGVLLYMCSRITANLGAIDALDRLGIPYALLEYLPHKGTYRQVERKEART